MSYQDIGKRIQQRRKELNLTQQELADRIQVTNKAISKWETGEGYPDISILNELSIALNMSVDELLGSQHQKNIEKKPSDLSSIYRIILLGSIPLLYLLPMVQESFFFFGGNGIGASQVMQRNGFYVILQMPYYPYPQLATLSLLTIFLIALTHLIAHQIKKIKGIDLFPWLKTSRIRKLNLFLMSVSLILPFYIAVMTGLEVGMILLVFTVIGYSWVEIKDLSISK